MRNLLSRIRFKRLLCIALIGYATILATLYFTQRSLLYHPFGHYTPHATAQELWLPTADAHKTLAWFLPPPEDSAGKVVVYFHGNGGSISLGTNLAARLQRAGFGVLMPEYRGYPGYAGKTTEQGIYADARASMEFLVSSGYDANDIYLLGQSLGSGVAVQMASEYPVGLLSLISPYTSIPDTAAAIYWYVPVQWLVVDRFDSLAKINNVHAPLQVFHGTHDGLVPFTSGEKLFAAAHEPKRFYTLEGSGHNDIDFGLVVRQMQRFAAEGDL